MMLEASRTVIALAGKNGRLEGGGGRAPQGGEAKSSPNAVEPKASEP